MLTVDSVIVDEFIDVFGDIGTELIALSSLVSIVSVVGILFIFRKMD